MIKKYLIFSFFLFFLAPNLLQAASINFEPSELSVNTKTFETTLVIDTQGQEVNAIEASIIVPTWIKLTEIKDGDSIISYWIEKPEYKDSKISFSGVIPGGFSGAAGKLFNLVFTISANIPQGAFIPVGSGRVLLNDGLGTQAKLSLGRLSLVLTGDIQSSNDTIPLPNSTDTTPPELFTPVISRDPNIYDNKWFVAFNTTDRESGIKFYQVQESSDPSPDPKKWITAENPYLLSDQSLTSYIFVKAVDRAGNERVITLLPQNQLSTAKQIVRSPLALFAIIILLIVILIAVRLIWKKKQKLI